jgi:hypothetical protein
MANDSLIKGIEDFVNRAPSRAVADRVSKYVTKLGAKGLVANERVLTIGRPELNSGAPAEEAKDWSPLQAFFAPVGYRPLFEQEIVFLLNEGISYESIMQMPVYLRKKLIDKKLKRDHPQDMDAPDIPPALLEQFRMAAQERREADSPLPPRG